jgi:hypothetical protein
MVATHTPIPAHLTLNLHIPQTLPALPDQVFPRLQMGELLLVPKNNWKTQRDATRIVVRLARTRATARRWAGNCVQAIVSRIVTFIRDAR